MRMNMRKARNGAKAVEKNQTMHTRDRVDKMRIGNRNVGGRGDLDRPSFSLSIVAIKD
jgi:hypothetical protein